MTEVIEFPDAEEVVIAFLEAQYAVRGIAGGVGTKVPRRHTSDDSFTRVSRAGGSTRDLVTDSALILVECFAPDTVTASQRAKVTRALVLASARLSKDITRASDGGGVSFLPDPDTNQPRYQFTVQLDLRGRAV